MRLAKRVSGIDESVTLEITSRAKKMAKEGIDVVSFAAGEPDFDTPKHIKDAAIRAINEGFTKYTPSSGMPELREAISKKFKVDNGIDYAASQIVVSNGAKHSLNNVFQALCDTGDEVLIPAPYWLSYPAMVRMAEATPVFVETKASNSFKVTPKDLEAKITKKTKCMVLNSPSNPTGGIYELEDLKGIAALAVKHDFFIVSDEIYEKLIYDGKKHYSIASLGKDIYERTITVNGVSKSYSMTGWRIGYAAGPADIMKAIGNLQSHATSNPSSISQKAALVGLSQDQSFVEDMRKEYEKRRDYMVNRVNAMKNISCFKPAGAFYLFCDISKTGKDSIETANRLLDEAKVAVIPGEPFGAVDWIRLSFATDMKTIEKGMDRMEEYFRKHG
ncbi:MAG: pyridoxal phosphate-dependent aminotransferase [Candidatus Omnitrophica bacterium]|nr:pyridoxal phosphate-dependent aminotransferase [Candidatus Omnitrophota bacterium]MCM8790127.1 pyridoxal phosphate-dependent aminotransferase [Candidatus Omnitrophota bacterium]